MHISTLMKIKNVRFLLFPLLLAFTLLALGLTGCVTGYNEGLPDTPASGTATNAATNPDTNAPDVLPRITVGDTVTVTLTGIEDLPPPLEKPVKDDGTI